MVGVFIALHASVLLFALSSRLVHRTEISLQKIGDFEQLRGMDVRKVRIQQICRVVLHQNEAFARLFLSNLRRALSKSRRSRGE